MWSAGIYIPIYVYFFYLQSHFLSQNIYNYTHTYNYIDVYICICICIYIYIFTFTIIFTVVISTYSAYYTGYFLYTNLVSNSHWQVNLDGL